MTTTTMTTAAAATALTKMMKARGGLDNLSFTVALYFSDYGKN